VLQTVRHRLNIRSSSCFVLVLRSERCTLLTCYTRWFGSSECREWFGLACIAAQHQTKRALGYWWLKLETGLLHRKTFWAAVCHFICLPEKGVSLLQFCA